jgi:hypothetical protein
MSMTEQHSKAWTYERIVQQLYERLLHADSDVVVHHRKQYVGKQSGQPYEIDVSFEFTKAGVNFLVLVECKCYSAKVEVADATAFAFKLQDIGAQKGILVTTVGFQKGVFNIAVASGIALVIVTEPGSGDVLISSRGPKSYFDWTFEEYLGADSCQETVPLLGLVGSAGEPPVFFNRLHMVWQDDVKYARWTTFINVLANPLESDAHSQELLKQAQHLRSERRFLEAISLAESALKILEESFDPHDLRVADALNLLAVLYEKADIYDQAESAAIRAVAIRQCELGSSHPDVVTSLNNLAVVYIAQYRDREAENHLDKARSIAIAQPFGTLLAAIECNLATIYARTGRQVEAAGLYDSALTKVTDALGPDHQIVADVAEKRAAFLKANAHLKRGSLLARIKRTLRM